MLSSAASELAIGSDVFGWTAAAVIADFRTGINDFAFLGALVDDRDTTTEGAIVAAIGSASGPLALNSTRLIVVDNGRSSAVFPHQSTDGNAAVTADELFMLAMVDGVTNLGPADFALSTFV